MFRAHVLIVRRAKLYYTVSGIITPIGGRPVHRLRESSLNLWLSHMEICDSHITEEYWTAPHTLKHTHFYIWSVKEQNVLSTRSIWNFKLIINTRKKLVSRQIITLWSSNCNWSCPALSKAIKYCKISQFQYIERTQLTVPPIII